VQASNIVVSLTFTVYFYGSFLKTTMAAALTYGLTHIAIAVKSVERTLQFYQQVFEMEVMYKEEKFIQLTTPGCNDILVFEERDEHLLGTSGGIAHFGFRLQHPNDIEKVNHRVVIAGGSIVDKGEFVPGSPYLFFKDPDGYLVEIWFELLPTVT
jgi:catechol 2,3-dioxygenase-like lactoylglutathione lyase family enzyme